MLRYRLTLSASHTNSKLSEEEEEGEIVVSGRREERKGTSRRW